METAKDIALKDIADHLREIIGDKSYYDKYKDVWIVGVKCLRGKEVRRMNKDLGITGLNMTGNTNGKSYILRKFGKYNSRSLN